MVVQDILTLYRCEMKSALRDRSIVIHSILIPVFLYPLLLWAMFMGITFVQGQQESLSARVAVLGWPPGHSQLRRQVEGDARIRMVEGIAGREEGEQKIRDGSIDAVVDFGRPAAPGFADDFHTIIVFDGSKAGSRAAKDRLSDLLEKYRADRLEREAARTGVTPGEWQVAAVRMQNVASGRQMGRLVLGLILPIFFVVMMAIASLYPAVDATAGERERGTWETQMTLGTSRASILLAKYLYVVTCCVLGGLLNMASMMLSIRPVLAPMLATRGETLELSISPASIPLILLGAVLLGAFIAACMMIFASFARTFREGQSIVMPFYMLVIVPTVFMPDPSTGLTPALALVPITNVTMMIREAIFGRYALLPIGITCGVSVALIGLSLFASAQILRFEDFVVGSYGGSMGQFVKERFFTRKRKTSNEGVR